MLCLLLSYFLLTVLQGFEAAIAAGAKEIAVFASASESFSKSNINCSIEESLARYRAVTNAAKKHSIPVRGYGTLSLSLPHTAHHQLPPLLLSPHKHAQCRIVKGKGQKRCNCFLVLVFALVCCSLLLILGRVVCIYVLFIDFCILQEYYLLVCVKQQKQHFCLFPNHLILLSIILKIHKPFCPVNIVCIVPFTMTVIPT